MAKVVFINLDEDREKHNGQVTSHFIPKVMWWFGCEINYRAKAENIDFLMPLNAKICNRLYKKDLAQFFKKYPDEIKKPIHRDYWGFNTNITKKEEKIYKKELSNIINNFYKEWKKEKQK